MGNDCHMHNYKKGINGQLQNRSAFIIFIFGCILVNSPLKTPKFSSKQGLHNRKLIQNQILLIFLPVSPSQFFVTLCFQLPDAFGCRLVRIIDDFIQHPYGLSIPSSLHLSLFFFPQHYDVGWCAL
eukprot:TRINITY_DN2532_c0_g1_i2.p2 TRINITY_DN2532_c0_g1~~TRINITY_DN2532_c0_g1_i2.p2  ORF type:complete len:126 (-),score=3.18 TRINITY_DN2532_c0_g1_i2:93-470(-)